jgi:hypothetical protein
MEMNRTPTAHRPAKPHHRMERPLLHGRHHNGIHTRAGPLPLMHPRHVTRIVYLHIHNQIRRLPNAGKIWPLDREASDRRNAHIVIALCLAGRRRRCGFLLRFRRWLRGPLLKQMFRRRRSPGSRNRRHLARQIEHHRPHAMRCARPKPPRPKPPRIKQQKQRQQVHDKREQNLPPHRLRTQPRTRTQPLFAADSDSTRHAAIVLQTLSTASGHRTGNPGIPDQKQILSSP